MLLFFLPFIRDGYSSLKNPHSSSFNLFFRFVLMDLLGKMGILVSGKCWGFAVSFYSQEGWKEEFLPVDRVWVHLYVNVHVPLPTYTSFYLVGSRDTSFCGRKKPNTHAHSRFEPEWSSETPQYHFSGLVVSVIAPSPHLPNLRVFISWNKIFYQPSLCVALCDCRQQLHGLGQPMLGEGPM